MLKYLFCISFIRNIHNGGIKISFRNQGHINALMMPTGRVECRNLENACLQGPFYCDCSYKSHIQVLNIISLFNQSIKIWSLMCLYAKLVLNTLAKALFRYINSARSVLSNLKSQFNNKGGKIQILLIQISSFDCDS